MRLNYVISPVYVSLQKFPMHNILAHSNYVSVQPLRRWVMTIHILANENIWTHSGSETVDCVLMWFNSSMASVNCWFSVSQIADLKHWSISHKNSCKPSPDWMVFEGRQGGDRSTFLCCQEDSFLCVLTILRWSSKSFIIILEVMLIFFSWWHSVVGWILLT